MTKITDKRHKWTPTVRAALYEAIVTKFGSYNTWENTYSPGKGLDETFDQFCVNFARTFGINSGNAVKTQISWSMPQLRNGNLRGPGYRHTPGDRSSGLWLIMNVVAADEAGFIDASGLDISWTMK